MEPILHSKAAELGLTPGHLRTARYEHPVSGVSVLSAEAGDLTTVCAAITLVLPDDAVFTHLTSARLRGWWLPAIIDEPIIACTSGEAPHLDRRGVYVRRCNLPTGHRTIFRGLPLASPEWTIVELAENLRLIDLVVVIDCALHLRHTTVDRIRATMRRGRRGVRVLRQALTLVDGRSDSPWETVLRLAHTLSGIRVEPQHQLRDEIGNIIWSLDMLITGTRRAAEFDGGVHRTAEVHQRDMKRDRLLSRHGIERYAYGAQDIRDDPAQIVHDAEEALGVARIPGRSRWWLEEFEQSSFHPQGYGRLKRRLKRFARTSPPRQRPPSGA